MVATKLVTIEELEAAPPTLERWELIEGELIALSPTNFLRGVFSVRISKALAKFVDEQRSGYVVADPGFVVERNPDTLLAPDVAYVSNERTAAMERLDRFAPFAPDLAIEIESPSNTQAELMRKVALYLEGGTTIVWLVRPIRHTVTVFNHDQPEQILTAADTLGGGAVLPGFALPLSELFEVRPSAE